MTSNLKAHTPLLLRATRLMEAFSKSDDERDFYLDKLEGFLLYIDIDKPMEEIDLVEQELLLNQERYQLIPKMTFYETKKFMEGFVNEKVYDIDTKEKLLDIISSKEARENFLEFIYDHLAELEKWQQYYQERSRIRIIEWLRTLNLQFVFEEDLDFPKSVMEKLKRHFFDAKVPKDVAQSRDLIVTKAKTYYSSEALNPRPKRGRPPKQVAKVELEPQVCVDLFTSVPPSARPFLFIPDVSNVSNLTFSSKDSEHLLARMKGSTRVKVNQSLESLSQRLESLRHLSSKLNKVSDILASDELSHVKKLSVQLPEEASPKMAGFLKDAFKTAPEDKSGQEKKSIKMVTPLKKKK
jgi:hypothetical protein